MAEDAEHKARNIIARLHAEGHDAQADHLSSHLAMRSVEDGFLFALREACETVLTAIEALDPVTQTMIEDLRLHVEKRLNPRDAPAGTK
jgi:hypothetical protein